MVYKCDKCEKIFTTKKCLIYHVNNNVCDKKLYSCRLCNRGFTTETSMYRHIRYSCGVKRQDDIERYNIYERLIKLEEDNKKKEDENRKLINEVNNIKKQITITNVTNNNVNNGTVVNHITLVGYGKEDLSKLDKNELIKILQNGFYSTLKLTESLHFNPKYPEFHNVYISNIKDKYAMMYDGQNWTLTIKDDLINRIYDDKKNYIEENLDEFIYSLTESRKKALERWLDMDDNDNKIKEIKEQIKLLLYNKREIPISTQSMMENNNQ